MESPLISYYGPFAYENIVSLADFLRPSQVRSALMRKLFKIFIEMSDNISKYSIEFNDINDIQYPYGSIKIFDLGDAYIIETRNRIDPSHWLPLQERCIKINYLDRQGLKKMRAKYRTVEEVKGGNIGLIAIAIISENRIGVSREKDSSGNNFLTISVRLDKHDGKTSDPSSKGELFYSKG